MDITLTSAQLAERLNATADATQSADQPSAPPALAGAELTLAQAQAAGLLPAVQVLTGLVERPPVAADEVDAILKRSQRMAQALEELKWRRAAEPELRELLAAAQALNAQYEQRIAELAAELEAARAVPALPADVVRLAVRVDSLLDELDAETE
jgi:hypothetical protein